MQNKQDHSKIQAMEMRREQPLVVISAGQHTRLGDVLEFALSDLSFETIEASDFLRGIWENRRLLFAVSADATGENAALRALTAGLPGGAFALEGCVCAAIADGASGGQAHLDMIRLLLAANAAGASVIEKPLLESGRELRRFAFGKETPFTQYRLFARELVTRLCAADEKTREHPCVQLVTALDDGIARDWRMTIQQLLTQSGGECADTNESEETILLCENTAAMPDEKTLSLLKDRGALRVLLASPATGSELYAACLIEHACLRGDYSLAPHAFVVFEGMSAVEVAASKEEMARMRETFAQR